MLSWSGAKRKRRYLGAGVFFELLFYDSRSCVVYVFLQISKVIPGFVVVRAARCVGKF